MRRSSWALAGIALGGAGLLGGVPSCAGELSGDPAQYRVVRSTSGGCDALPVFTKGCATKYCHSAMTQSSGLDLESAGLAARLVGGASKSKGCEPRLLVDPSDPSKSFLLEKLENASPECGVQMPLTGTLSAEDLACVKSWVAALGTRDGGGVAPTADAGVVPRADAGTGARDSGGMK